MAAALAAPLQQLATQFTLRAYCMALTDGALGGILRLGSMFRRLFCERLYLHSSTHAAEPWPWQELRVFEPFDVAVMCKLPDPAAAGACEGPVVVCCDTLRLYESTTTEVCVLARVIRTHATCHRLAPCAVQPISMRGRVDGYVCAPACPA